MKNSRFNFSSPPAWWVIVILAAILWGGEYVLRDLWAPDEARYAYVAGEMAERGDWAVPHRHGEFYAHKPPLMFWMIQAGSYLTNGINGVSTRLPSLFGAILSLLAATRLAARWGGGAASWRTLGILLTSYLFWAKGGMGQIDSLLCGLEMGALWILFTLPKEGRSNWRAAWAWILMGLGILAKGPVGLLVPLGVYVAGSIGAREGRQLLRQHFLWGPLVALAVPGAWLLWVKLGGAPAGYLEELLYKQNVDRAAGSYGHTKPFYYFLTRYPPQFFPWALFLPAAFLAFWKLEGPEKRVWMRLFVWIGFVILFFSISPSKRDLYILLAYPASAILLALAWPKISQVGARRWEAMVVSALPVYLGSGACVAILASQFGEILPFSGWVLLPLAVICLTGGCFLFWEYERSQTVGGRWLVGLMATIFLIQMGVSHFVYPAVDPVKTPAPIHAAAAEHIDKGDRIFLYHTMGEIVALYADRRGQYFESSSEMLAAMEAQGKGLVVMKESHFEKLPEKVRVLLPESNPFPMGSKKMVWCPFEGLEEQ